MTILSFVSIELSALYSELPGELAGRFSDLFTSKISTIRHNISLSSNTATFSYSTFCRLPLTDFQPATSDKVAKVRSSAPSKSRELDPLPAWLLKQLALWTVCLTSVLG